VIQLRVSRYQTFSGIICKLIILRNIDKTYLAH